MTTVAPYTGAWIETHIWETGRLQTSDGTAITSEWVENNVQIVANMLVQRYGGLGVRAITESVEVDEWITLTETG